MDKLKRCPFCGSHDVEMMCEGTKLSHVAAAYAKTATCWWVQCNQCVGTGPTGGTRAGAEERWDHRYRGPGKDGE